MCFMIWTKRKMDLPWSSLVVWEKKSVLSSHWFQPIRQMYASSNSMLQTILPNKNRKKLVICQVPANTVSPVTSNVCLLARFLAASLFVCFVLFCFVLFCFVLFVLFCLRCFFVCLFVWFIYLFACLFVSWNLTYQNMDLWF